MEKTSDEFNNILSKLNELKNELNAVTKQIKLLSKTTTKNKKSNTVSGFVKPVNVKENMQSFLNISKDEKVSRSYVNKKINEYIKENDLQIQDSKQNFIIDEKLSSIFNVDKGTQMNYFKMQKFLKHNYIKCI